MYLPTTVNRACRRPVVIRIRRPLVLVRRVVLQCLKDDLDRLFELRVAALAPGFGVELDFDVGGDAVVFLSDHHAIYKNWRSGSAAPTQSRKLP